MAISFELVGRFALPKETEKFKPYEERTFASGWISRTLKFNVLSGHNSFLLNSQGGHFENKDNDIYVFSKGSVDADGNRVKGESFTIPFSKRLTHKRLDEVAEFKKFTIDLEESVLDNRTPGNARMVNKRFILQQLQDKSKEGNVTDEDLKVIGLSSVDEIEEALEKSNKKRKEFISAWDYAEFIKKLIDSGKYKDKKFRVRGNVEAQYSYDKQRWYMNYVPNRIYLCSDNEEEMAESTATVFFDENAVDAASLDEKGKYFVNAYTFEYDSTTKKNLPCPYSFVILDSEDEKIKKRNSKLVEWLTPEEGTVKELGIVLDMINGSSYSPITMEDLDEETRENIEMGLVDFADVVRELGGEVANERVTEDRFKKLARGYAKGAQDTSYTSEDLAIKSLDTDEDLFEEDLADSDDDSDFDLFD